MHITGVFQPVAKPVGIQSKAPASACISQPKLNADVRFSGVSPLSLFRKRPNSTIKEICKAVDHNDRERIQQLLAGGANINGRHYGFTPLMHAATNGNDEMVDFLVAAGADPNMLSSDRYTALALVLSEQKEHISDARYRVIDKLIPITDVNHQPRSGEPILNLAIHNGYYQSIESLLTHGAKINVAGRDKLTPLMHAAMNGKLWLVQKLLHGVPKAERLDYINARNKLGRTALSIAHSGGRNEIARFLESLGGVDPWKH